MVPPGFAVHQLTEHMSLRPKSVMKWSEENTYATCIPTPGVFICVYLYLLLCRSFILAGCSVMASVLASSASDGAINRTLLAIGGALEPCVLVIGKTYDGWDIPGPEI